MYCTMRGSLLTFFVTIIAIAGLHAFKAFQDTTLTGHATPAEAVAGVMAVNEKDTVRAAASQGAFALKVKPGSWKIIVSVRAPFKNAVLERVQVKEGQTTDIGMIKLEQ